MSTFCLRSVSRALWIGGLLLCCLQCARADQQVWHTVDIGKTGAAGSAKYASSIFMVSGAGEGLDGTAEDAFRYLYQGISGNATVIARVITLEETNDQACAGIMNAPAWMSNRTTPASC